MSLFGVMNYLSPKFCRKAKVEGDVSFLSDNSNNAKNPDCKGEGPVGGLGKSG